MRSETKLLCWPARNLNVQRLFKHKYKRGPMLQLENSRFKQGSELTVSAPCRFKLCKNR